jgi:serine phosphatase RsbU (regulator of sigma subunit)
LGVLIADAQGHGFSAALLVAVLKTCLHGISEREPAAVLEAMNRAILENLPPHQNLWVHSGSGSFPSA